ncbi:MAG: hypothetical protein QM784_36665 [Polyangiaceae bacterium]
MSDRRDSTVIGSDGTTSGTLELRSEPVELGTPGDLVTFAVDSGPRAALVRQRSHAVAQDRRVSALDVGSRMKSALVDRDGAGELRAMLGESMSLSPTSSPDPTTGWPPAPIPAIINPPLPREGAFEPRRRRLRGTTRRWPIPLCVHVLARGSIETTHPSDRSSSWTRDACSSI